MPNRDVLGLFNSSVIRQKGEFQNGCFRKTKHHQIFRKINICSFYGKFGVLRFLETPALRFAILPYYRQTQASLISRQ